MAVQARIMDQEMVEIKYRKEVYEQLWIIPDWFAVQEKYSSLTTQNFHFETGKSSRVQTKWETGFNVNHSAGNFGIYWKLVGMTGTDFPDKKLQTTISYSLLLADSSVVKHEMKEMTFEVNQIHNFHSEIAYRLNRGSWSSYINSNGELTFKLNLTLTYLEPEAPAAQMKMEQFRKSSLGKIGSNLATLLNDNSTADLKILTRDGKELLGHRAILKAQCPVFDSMFRSKMSENQSGIVDIQDITGKTMRILLRYFYSGELLPSWKDEDTVVEFTYAAGKYQLTDILELLDVVLGTRDEKDATQTDVLLLDLAAKLGLKTAEKELLLRIAEKTNKVQSRDELFGLYGLKN